MSDKTKLTVERVSLSELLGSDQMQFVIPHYQRKYSWNKEHCETLFEDVLKVANAVIEGHQVTHFFSNVTLSRLDGKNRFHVVDGQQRLTTLSLFLKAVSHVLPIHSEPLVEHLQVGPLLKLSFEDAMDQRTYRHLMKERFCEPESVSQVMVENFKFFEERITAEKDTFANVCYVDLMSKLLLVKIVLPETMTPQRVFERMNGVRKPLKQLDLIKNFLLMAAGTSSEETVYNRWEDDLVPSGWLHWVCWMISTMHAQQAVAEKNIYKNFKQFYEKHGKIFGSVPKFFEQIEFWHQGFAEIGDAFNQLNGNAEMQQQHRDRLGPLMMKLAIVFSSPEDRSRRNELVAVIVAYQRCFVAGRLLDFKHHPARWDWANARKCLQESGKEYDKDRLHAAIVGSFSSNTLSAETRLKKWYYEGDKDYGRSRNARMIGIWREREREWGSADEVVSHFYETFRKSKKDLGILSDAGSVAKTD